MNRGGWKGQHDPRLRKDGHCSACKKKRIKRPSHAYATRFDYERDPFCSRKCCQDWWGIMRDTAIYSSITYHKRVRK